MRIEIIIWPFPLHILTLHTKPWGIFNYGSQNLPILITIHMVHKIRLKTDKHGTFRIPTLKGLTDISTRSTSKYSFRMACSMTHEKLWKRASNLKGEDKGGGWLDEGGTTGVDAGFPRASPTWLSQPVPMPQGSPFLVSITRLKTPYYLYT